jgi:hypothetical protein
LYLSVPRERCFNDFQREELEWEGLERDRSEREGFNFNGLFFVSVTVPPAVAFLNEKL